MSNWFIVAIQSISLVVLIAGIRSIRRGLKRIRETLLSVNSGRTVTYSADSSMTEAFSVKVLLFFRKPRVRELFETIRAGRKKEQVGASETDGSCDPVQIRFDELAYGLNKTIRKLPISVPVDARGKTAICNVAVGEKFRGQIEECLKSHEGFANRHGFDYFSLSAAPLRFDRPVAWLKIPLILKLLSDGYNRVLCIDADALITNPDFNVSELFDKIERSDKGILLSEDEDGVNSGVSFTTRSVSAFDLFELVWLFDADIHNGTWEQFALKYLMDISNEVKDFVSIEPNQKMFNSFPRERSLFHPTDEKQYWTRGDFICHFSGLRAPHLQRYISDYSKALSRPL